MKELDGIIAIKEESFKCGLDDGGSLGVEKVFQVVLGSLIFSGAPNH